MPDPAEERRQIANHTRGVALELAPRDADHAPARRLEQPVALAIALEGGAARVVGVTIDLDDHVGGEPREVDLQPPAGDGDARVDQRARESGPLDEDEESGLEVAARPGVQTTGFEECPQGRRAGATAVALQKNIEGERADEAERLRLLGRSLQLGARENRGEVEQGARGVWSPERLCAPCARQRRRTCSAPRSFRASAPRAAQ